MEEDIIDLQVYNYSLMHRHRRGFTLLEVLVVIFIISMLMGILMPVLGQAKRKAKTLLGINNQKQIVAAANLFTSDNNGKYPNSVAVVGVPCAWRWSDPRKLIGPWRTPKSHRAISVYLGSYIQDTDIMFCPNGPKPYKYLQTAWNAGDNWDNPDTPINLDPLGGTYCFWWNYIGYLGPGRLFVGPRSSTGSRQESKILVSDYFGYNQCQSYGAFGSCERFDKASIADETWLLSAYWCRSGSINSSRPDIKLHAGYTDGHVDSFTSLDTVPMRVSKSADGTVPESGSIGLGIFYLPKNGLH